MTYRIAAIYGFSLTDPVRRGEVVAIWGLSTSGAGVLKTGLSLVEVIPVVGTIVGPTSNAALLYSLGQIARYFYEEKKKASQISNQTSAQTPDQTSAQNIAKPNTVESNSSNTVDTVDPVSANSQVEP